MYSQCTHTHIIFAQVPGDSQRRCAVLDTCYLSEERRNRTIMIRSDDVTCPVCNKVLGSISHPPNMLTTDSHISRCLRQSSKRINGNINDYADGSETEAINTGLADYGGLSSGDDIDRDWSDEDESGAESSGDISESAAAESADPGDLSFRSARKRERPSRPQRPASTTTRAKRARVEKLKDDIAKSTYMRRLQTIQDLEISSAAISNDVHDALPDKFETPFGSIVTRRCWDLLYEHQRRGCRWLWGLYTDKCGGILADEMGLG